MKYKIKCSSCKNIDIELLLLPVESVARLVRLSRPLPLCTGTRYTTVLSTSRQVLVLPSNTGAKAAPVEKTLERYNERNALLIFSAPLP